MKEILFEKHISEGFCGPSCLQFVARSEGLHFDQYQLARILGTTIENGTDHYQMFCGAITIGLQPTQVLGQPIETIAKALPDFHVIVNWMEDLTPDGGHYSVLKDVRDGIVYLEDNDKGVKDFDKRWYDFEEGNVRVDRWALIIRKRPPV
jgi:ABC-type bacteriocin/lantibiotic exporter with double-glycine peptidase domain